MPSTPPAPFDVDVNLLFKVPQDVITGHIPFPTGHYTLFRGVDIGFPVSQLRLNNRSSEFDVAFFLGSHGHAFTIFPAHRYTMGIVSINQSKTLTLVIDSADDIPEHCFLFLAKVRIEILRSRIDVESFFRYSPRIRSLKTVQLKLAPCPYDMLMQYYRIPNPSPAEQDRAHSPHAQLTAVECSSSDGSHTLNPFLFN